MKSVATFHLPIRQMNLELEAGAPVKIRHDMLDRKGTSVEKGD